LGSDDSASLRSSGPNAGSFFFSSDCFFQGLFRFLSASLR